MKSENSDLKDSLGKTAALMEGLAQDKISLNRTILQVIGLTGHFLSAPTHPLQSVLALGSLVPCPCVCHVSPPFPYTHICLTASPSYHNPPRPCSVLCSAPVPITPLPANPTLALCPYAYHFPLQPTQSLLFALCPSHTLQPAH